jgi:hypothetical protein
MMELIFSVSRPLIPALVVFTVKSLRPDDDCPEVDDDAVDVDVDDGNFETDGIGASFSSLENCILDLFLAK